MNPLSAIGRATLDFVGEVGRLAIFIGNALMAVVRPPIFWSIIFSQFVRIGYFSLPVVGLTAVFTGGALALQIFIGGDRYGAEEIVPQIVVLGITRELGPVIASLMVAGRVSAAIAAEIGTMRVTEQIDALRTLSTNPYNYLVAPRLIAAVITMPLLVLTADVLGVLGGYLVATLQLGFNPAVYLKNTWEFVRDIDVISGLVKACVFGFIIAILGCYQGFHSRGGAQGVGKATTDAVVTASILILASNFVITGLFFR